MALLRQLWLRYLRDINYKSLRELLLPSQEQLWEAFAAES